MISKYLCRSLRRKPLRHFALFWIMLCAFLLPLVVSTYRDSLEYGTHLQINSISKGATFHISGAALEDVELFRNIDGLTEPVYEDGTIYISYSSVDFWILCHDLERLNTMPDEEYWDFFDEEQRIQNALDSAMSKSSHSLSIMGYAYDMWSMAMEDSPSLQAHMQDVLYLNLALILFSGVIVYSAYGNHIHGFSQEIADLHRLGATTGQIVRLFLTEFFLLFPLAAAGSVGLSAVVMRYLYEHFLGNTADSVAVWEVFYMDPKNTALEILFYFLLCLCALMFSLLHCPRSRTYKSPRTRSASLPARWRRQTKPPILRCLLIILPLVVAFVLLLNRYLGIYTRNVYDMGDAKIVVTSNEDGFSQYELDAAEAIVGAGNVQQFRDITELFCLTSVSDGRLMTVSIRSYREAAPQSPPLAEYEIAVNLPEGDAAYGTYLMEGISHPEMQFEVALTRMVSAEDQDGLNAYVSDALMQKLMASAPVNRLEIHTSAQAAKALERTLREQLPSIYNISNYQNLVDTSTAKQEGRLLLLSWIFCILMIVAMQIVWVRLTAYVQECAPMLHILQQVGASRTQIARLIPARSGAICAAVLPFAIAVPWAWLEAAQSSRPFVVSAPVLGIYAAVALLAAAVFLLPVRHALHRVLTNPKS